jgi:cation transport ATPase
LPLTIGVAGLAWLISGAPIRALAVLVVATPCPLILAAPVAIVAGVSKAARRGIIVKRGGALDTIARGKTLILDKTGTVTAGSPALTNVERFGTFGADDLLRLAASLDQVSPHVLAGPILRAASERQLALSFPTEVSEEPGAGIRCKVDGNNVALGKSSWVCRVKRRHSSFADCSAVSCWTGLPASSFPSKTNYVARWFSKTLSGVTPLTLRSLRRSGL